MKLLKRRMTFQLTPLLDLLLIVIFAQFLDVDQKSQADAQSLDSAESRAKSVEERAELAIKARDDLAKELEAERKRFDEQLAQMERQQKEFGDLVSRLFRIPKDTVDEAIKAIESAVRTASVQEPLTAEKLTQVREQFDRIAETQGREAVQHILTFEEMTRRLEIWELNVDQLGQVVFKTGTKTFPPFEFRPTDEGAPKGRGVDAAAALANFSNGVYDRYKRLTPHGKSIVLILVRFDRKIRYYHLRPMMEALPKLLERLQRESLGATRYEYAIMGDLGFSSSSE